MSDWFPSPVFVVTVLFLLPPTPSISLKLKTEPTPTLQISIIIIPHFIFPHRSLTFLFHGGANGCGRFRCQCAVDATAATATAAASSTTTSGFAWAPQGLRPGGCFCSLGWALPWRAGPSCQRYWGLLPLSLLLNSPPARSFNSPMDRLLLLIAFHAFYLVRSRVCETSLVFRISNFSSFLLLCNYTSWFGLGFDCFYSCTMREISCLFLEIITADAQSVSVTWLLLLFFRVWIFPE